MIHRQIENYIFDSLKRSPVVTLLGPRQIGKTTLAFSISKSFSKPCLYLDLERPSDVAKLQDPEYFLMQHLDKLIILDEIQRASHILPILRSLIDERRRNGDHFAHYLLLGSSSKVLLKSTSDSLAGRIQYIDIYGFNLLDVGNENVNKLWVTGGFPISYLMHYEDSFKWLDNIIRTYLERELPILGYQIPSLMIRRFWGMLAYNQGELFNASKFATSLGVSIPTVNRYLNILADLFLIRILRPWSNNEGKRLIKSPKVYIRDSGLLHSLLSIKTLDDILMHSVAGGSWEGFVIENIASLLHESFQLFFYRTVAGSEMDLVLERGNSLIGIEIKRSLTPSLTKGGINAMEDLKLKHVYIVYPGVVSYKITDKVTVVPLIEMLNIAKSLTDI